MNNWKQPTPTDINQCEGLTFLDRAIFREILSLCQNKAYPAQFKHAKRHYKVRLERGQCIFKVSKVAQELHIDRKRVRRSIDTISEWYTKLNSKAMPYGLIITVIDYDELTKMDSRRTIEGQWKDSRRTANKSDKSVKKKYIPTPAEGKSASTPRQEDATRVKSVVGKKTTNGNAITGGGAEYGNKYVNWLEEFLDEHLTEGCPTVKYRKSIRNVIWNIVQILTQTKTNRHRLPTFKKNMLRFWRWYKTNRLREGYEPQYIETVLANVKKYDKIYEKQYNDKHKN